MRVLPPGSRKKRYAGMISPVHEWVAEHTVLGRDLNPGTLHAWQSERVAGTVRYARENSRFYRNLLNDYNDLTELPYTLPSDLANDPLAFLAVAPNRVARVSTLAHSGTTYLKKRVFFSESDLERTMDFFSAGMRTMTSPGDHVRILISNRTENSLGSLLNESLKRIGVCSEISGVIRTAGKAIEDSESADCLVGMPAEIIYMCRTNPALRPKSVLLAADIASRAVIKSIEEAWKCKVFTHYGHTEFGYGCAVDCEEHNGLHLRDADLLFEIIDPVTNEPAIRGESGEIVITTLSNEAMPLIRYRTGNISHFIDAPCRCGGTLPRLSRIEGRSNNLVLTSNGKTVNIYKLDEIIFADPVVRGFEVKYEASADTLFFIMDSSDKIDPDSLLPALPAGIKIKITYAKADPFSRRTKRYIQVI